jgi:hypothetical protein
MLDPSEIPVYTTTLEDIEARWPSEEVQLVELMQYRGGLVLVKRAS